MTTENEKPFVRLENTQATTTDEDGNSRVRMEALSKGGERDSDGDVDAPTGEPTEQDQ